MPIGQPELNAAQQVVGQIFSEIYLQSPLRQIPLEEPTMQVTPRGEAAEVDLRFRMLGMDLGLKVDITQPNRLDQPEVQDDIASQVIAQLQEIAMALSQQAQAAGGGAPPPGAGPGGGPGAGAGERGAPPGGGRQVDVLSEVEKQRVLERAQEEEEAKARAQAIASSLRYTQDDLGVVVAPETKLGDVSALSPYVVSKLDGDVPSGLPSQLADKLQGKRIDIAVRVDFASEVLVEGRPADRKTVEAAETIDLAGLNVKALPVQAPRLAPGTLLSHNKKLLFISRPVKHIPAPWLRELLE